MKNKGKRKQRRTSSVKKDKETKLNFDAIEKLKHLIVCRHWRFVFICAWRFNSVGSCTCALTYVCCGSNRLIEMHFDINLSQETMLFHMLYKRFP